MEVIYADEVFLENLIVDYLLLAVTGRIAGTGTKRLRALAAAALGGAYALLARLSGWALWDAWPVRILVGLLMVLTVFGASERLFRLALLFFGVSAAFAGAVMAGALIRGEGVSGAAIGRVSLPALILAFAVFYALFSAVFSAVARARVRGGTAQLTIRRGGRRVRVTALLDTGNCLRSALTGLPVAVCSLEAAAPLLDGEALRILRTTPDTAEALVKLSEAGDYSFFPVPYRAVGVKGGLLPAFRPDSVTLGGRPLNVAVAVARSGVSDGQGYAAIVGV